MTPAERSREYRARRGEPYRLERSQRNRERRLASPARFLWLAARRRARATGIRFTITEADVTIPKRCPVLGLRLRTDRQPRGPDSASLDRINNRKGYIQGNVVVVSWRANHIKSDATPAELAAVAKFYGKL